MWNGTAKRGDYNTTAESWKEQRLFVTAAPRLLEAEHPQLAASLGAALCRPVQAPTQCLFVLFSNPTAGC